MRLFHLILIMSFSASLSSLKGQQDPMYAEYMFNSLSYNPAYAGAKEHLAAGLIHRTQWWKIREAPKTQSFYLHAPLKNKRVGLGINGLHDQIGISRTFAFYGNYAYRIPLEESVLSIGICAGAHSFSQDLTELSLEEADDEAFLASGTSLLPNVGLGIYFQSEFFYAGLSAPRLMEPELRTSPDQTVPGRLYRHFFLQLGGVIPLGDDEVLFKPSLLARSVGFFGLFSYSESERSTQAPTEIDLDISFLFSHTIWIGSSLRAPLTAIRSDRFGYRSVDLWGAYYFDNGLRIGGAFDYPLGALQTIAGGSFELFLGYEFDIRTKRMATPRYF
jgi:type IX secretion system PorP/SprF family membrane protein